ncbi:hypothetical protein D3C81_2095070 [compost metagenome]
MAPKGVQPALISRRDHCTHTKGCVERSAVIASKGRAVQLVAVLDASGCTTYFCLDPRVELCQLAERTVIAGDQIVCSYPPWCAAGVVVVITVIGIFQEVGGCRFVHAA